MTELILAVWHPLVVFWRVIRKHPDPLRDRPDWWLKAICATPMAGPNSFRLACLKELIVRYGPVISIEEIS